MWKYPVYYVSKKRSLKNAIWFMFLYYVYFYYLLFLYIMFIMFILSRKKTELEKLNMVCVFKSHPQEDMILAWLQGVRLLHLEFVQAAHSTWTYCIAEHCKGDGPVPASRLGPVRTWLMTKGMSSRFLQDGCAASRPDLNRR